MAKRRELNTSVMTTLFLITSTLEQMLTDSKTIKTERLTERQLGRVTYVLDALRGKPTP